MSPVSTATTTALPTGISFILNPEPFEMTISADGTISCGTAGAAFAPDTGNPQTSTAALTQSAAMPVPVADLVAALDRAACTTIAPAPAPTPVAVVTPTLVLPDQVPTLPLAPAPTKAPVSSPTPIPAPVVAQTPSPAPTTFLAPFVAPSPTVNPAIVLAAAPAPAAASSPAPTPVAAPVPVLAPIPAPIAALALAPVIPSTAEPVPAPDCAPTPLPEAEPTAAEMPIKVAIRVAQNTDLPAPVAADTDVGQDTKDADEQSADTAVVPPPATPVVQAALPVNPLIALVAASPLVMVAPVVVRATVADTSPDADDSVQSAKLPEIKTAYRAPAPTEAKVAKPADPAMAALFAMAKEAARATEPARNTPSVDVSVTMLSDTASDADTTPTFSLPTAPAAVQQLASIVSAQPVAAPDAMINRHLDLVRGDAWLDTLAQDIASIAGTGDRLRFALQPEHLGKLDVEVSRHETGVAVHMTTRSEEARQIIAAAQPRLLDELRANGTRVVAADVASQMNAHTDGQSGNASRRPAASFIEAAIDVRTPTTLTTTKDAAADGRYA
jgi:flagellar hook-length control protein FliK